MKVTIMVDIYGTDIDDAWDFSDGDINLISGTLNLQQAIKNRLMSDSNFYKAFYHPLGRFGRPCWISVQQA